MVNQERTVALILDPDFGEITPLLNFSAVWIIDSLENRSLIAPYWGQQIESQGLPHFTTFKSRDDETVEEHCLRLLDVIELHHGKYSANPPYAALEVIGCNLTSKVKRKLRQLGFEKFVKANLRFRAIKLLTS